MVGFQHFKILQCESCIGYNPAITAEDRSSAGEQLRALTVVPMAGQEYENPARFLFLYSQRPEGEKRKRLALQGFVLEMNFGRCTIVERLVWSQVIVEIQIVVNALTSLLG